MRSMTTPTVTEIPPSLARVEPDPFIEVGMTPRTTKPASGAGFREYRYGDSNPGFRRERAAS